MISVIVPLHNKEAYVEQTLQSLTKQRHQKWEAIVVENHSSDRGPDLIERYAKDESRVRLLRLPTTLRGPGAARNFGVQQARGDWLLFLDADDLLMPEHLESLLEITSVSKSHVDIVASDWREFRDGEWNWNVNDDIVIENIQNMSVRKAGGSSHLDKGTSVQDSSIAYAPWAIHCGLIRRSLLSSDCQWVEKLDCHPSEDTAFWFRVLQGSSVAYTRKATALYRTETSNFRNTHEDLARWSAALEAIHAENVSFLESSGGEVNASQAESLMRIWSQIGQDSLRKGLSEIAARSYKEADLWKSKAAWSSPGIVLRKILGCRLSDRILALKLRTGI